MNAPAPLAVDERNRIVTANLGLVHAFISRMATRIPWRIIDGDDLAQELSRSLMISVEAWHRKSRQHALSTYFWRRALHSLHRIVSRHQLIYTCPTQPNKRKKYKPQPGLDALKRQARRIVHAGDFYTSNSRFLGLAPNLIDYDWEWDCPEYRRGVSENDLQRAIAQARGLLTLGPRDALEWFLRDPEWGWQRRFAKHQGFTKQRAGQLANKMLPVLRRAIQENC